MIRALTLLALLAPALASGNWALDFDEDFTSASSSLLPAGYAECKYISSTGTQYVDTGIKLSFTNSVAITFETESLATYGVFGGRDFSAGTSYAMFALSFQRFRYDFQTGIQVQGGLSYGAQTKYTVIVTPAKATVNGTTDAEYSCTVATVYNAYLMAVNTGGTAGPTFSGKFYGASITGAGGVIANFVPCLNASGAPGVYDTVRKSFHPNIGTGSFGWKLK